jgi:hypothetical protein
MYVMFSKSVGRETAQRLKGEPPGIAAPMPLRGWPSLPSPLLLLPPLRGCCCAPGKSGAANAATASVITDGKCISVWTCTFLLLSTIDAQICFVAWAGQLL